MTRSLLGLVPSLPDAQFVLGQLDCVSALDGSALLGSGSMLG